MLKVINVEVAHVKAGLCSRDHSVPEEMISYIDFLGLCSKAWLALTDSGGIQEETTVLGVPCVTLRETTERPITVEMGTNIIAGTDPQRIAEAAFAALDRSKPGNHRVPLWDGHTAERILSALT